MTAWMNYLYGQQPKPANSTGVNVDIYVLDANNNYRQIGTTTSNSDGFYSLSWKTDIVGKFTVFANFAGSESYYPSNAVTAFTVESAAATSAPTQQALVGLVTTNDLMMYLAVSVIAIIIAIAIVGLLLLRKRP